MPLAGLLAWCIGAVACPSSYPPPPRALCACGWAPLPPVIFGGVQVNVATASLATAGEGLLRQIREVKLAAMLQVPAAGGQPRATENSSGTNFGEILKES